MPEPLCTPQRMLPRDRAARGDGAPGGGRRAHTDLEDEDEDYGPEGWDAPEPDDFWDRKRRGKAREVARFLRCCDAAAEG